MSLLWYIFSNIFCKAGDIRFRLEEDPEGEEGRKFKCCIPARDWDAGAEILDE